jgi:hypothetical protein
MEILKDLTPEEQQLVAAVISEERSILHIKKPRNVFKDGLWKKVTEIVK